METDVLTRGGRVVDGTGAPAVAADVAIARDRIVGVGRVDVGARRTIDADSLLVCPGFVDVHIHSDLPLLVEPKSTASSTCRAARTGRRPAIGDRVSVIPNRACGTTNMYDDVLHRAGEVVDPLPIRARAAVR